MSRPLKAVIKDIQELTELIYAPPTPVEIAEAAIDLFIEYRDQYGYNEKVARAKAVLEIVTATRDIPERENSRRKKGTDAQSE